MDGVNERMKMTEEGDNEFEEIMPTKQQREKDG